MEYFQTLKRRHDLHYKERFLNLKRRSITQRERHELIISIAAKARFET